jgi:hypothetical protein
MNAHLSLYLKTIIDLYRHRRVSMSLDSSADQLVCCAFSPSRKRVVITLHHLNWMMCLNEDRFDDDLYIVCVLFKLLNHKLLVCVRHDQIWWSQIDVDSWYSRLISNVSCRNILQSFVRLKTNCFVHYMQNEFIIIIWFSFHIEYVYHNTIIKLNIFVSYWKNLSKDELQLIEKYLKEHLNKNFIESSIVSYASLILFAKKSDDELRFCVDYKKLNVIIKKNRYSISFIAKTIAQLFKTKWMCSG